MRDWIVILVLYGVGIGLFHILGGLQAAGDAFRRWGRASSTIQRNHASASS